MSVTLNDIALKAGVSVSTVSRVLNHKTKTYRISKKTQDLVLEAAENLKYRPNELARGLRLKKTHTIGLVVPDISNPFFASITHNIQKYAFDFGYSLVVCNTDENLEAEIEQIDLLRRKGIDGFIILPVGTEASHIEELLIANKPLVILDRYLSGLDTNLVLVDNYYGAYKATEYLIRSGHERIGVIQGLKGTSTNTSRVEGYVKAHEDNGIEVHPEYIVGNDFRKVNGYIETKLLLNMAEPPTAVFTTSDLITLGALQAIFEEKLRIPNDISIVAFDDIDFAPYLISPLTTVRQPRELMGEAAVKLLLSSVKNKESNLRKKIVLKPKLMIRKSVKQLIQSTTDDNHI